MNPSSFPVSFSLARRRVRRSFAPHFFAALACGAVFTAGETMADTTWTGASATSAAWSDVNNWNNGVPSATNPPIFDAAALGLSNTANTVNAATTINALTYNGGQNYTTTLGGTDGVLVLGAAAVVTVTGGSQVIAGGGSATSGNSGSNGLAGEFNLTSSTAVTNNFNIASGASLLISARLGRSTTNSVTGTVTKSGGGVLELSGNNGGSAGAVVNYAVTAGVLRFSNAIALGGSTANVAVSGSGALQLNGVDYSGPGGTLSLAGAGNGSLGALRVTAGTANAAFSATTANAGIALTGSTRLGVDTGAVLNVSGGRSGGAASNSNTSISGAFAITKVGGGMLSLAGTSTYTGGTTVAEGTLSAINTTGTATGTGAVTVSNGATLAGTGFINASVAGAGITVDGTLSPGTTATPAGTINFQAVNGLTLSSTSNLTFDVANGAKDAVALTNTTLTLGGGKLTLNVGTITLGTPYALVTGINGTVTGTFGTVTGYDSSSYTPSFAQNGTEYDVTFSPVPEPGTTALVGAGALALGILYRRRARTAC